jgi:hypothetical protein
MFELNGAKFGWAEIQECLERDNRRDARRTKLCQASVEIDAYSTMCVSYAKAPSAWETLMEQCDHIANALQCHHEVVDLPRKSALDLYRHVVPFLRGKITLDTPYHVQSALNTFEYTSVVGAMFNEFFLNADVRVTTNNIDDYEKDMMDLLGFYDRWNDEDSQEANMGNRRRNFISATTYKNMQSSIRGFFCRRPGLKERD